MAKYTSIRTIISLVSIFGWKMYQMDVKTAFLNGNIEQEVFMNLKGLYCITGKLMYASLKKHYMVSNNLSKYGIDGFLKDLGFQKNDVDSNIYLIVIKNQPLFLVLYVDDIFLTGEDNLIEWCKKELINEFEMKYLGLLHYFLGLEVKQSKDEVFMSQGKYTMDILKMFDMLDCKSMSTTMVTNLKKLHDSNTRSDLIDSTMYKQLIGSLLYLIHTGPDICYVVNALNQFMGEPKQKHWVATKHVLKYLRGFIAYGLKYTSSGGIRLHGYADSNWA